MKLYEISSEYQHALNIMTEDGTDEQIITDSLELIKDDFENKVIAVGKFIKNIDSDVGQLKEMEKATKERRQKLEKRIKSIKQYLLLNMKKTGITKISSPYFDVQLKNNPVSVEVDDVGQLECEYVKAKTEIYADKEAIKKYLKEGGFIAGARLIQNKRVEIK